MPHTLAPSSPYTYFWPENTPRAQWMRVEEKVKLEPGHRPAYFLRKEFEITKVVSHACIAATAQGVYNI